MISFGNRIVADAVRIIYCFKQGRTERVTVDTGTDMHSGRIFCEDEGRDEVLMLAEMASKPAEAEGKSMEPILHPQKEPTLLTARSWIPSLSNCETIDFCCVSHSVCGISLQQHWQTNILDQTLLSRNVIKMSENKSPFSFKRHLVSLNGVLSDREKPTQVLITAMQSTGFELHGQLPWGV